MKRHPKLLRTDTRGQLVIPKELRRALNITEDTGFYAYLIPGEGILLKQVQPEPLDKSNAIEELKRHAEQLGINPEAIDRAVREHGGDL